MINLMVRMIQTSKCNMSWPVPLSLRPVKVEPSWGDSGNHGNPSIPASKSQILQRSRMGWPRGETLGQVSQADSFRDAVYEHFKTSVVSVSDTQTMARTHMGHATWFNQFIFKGHAWDTLGTCQVVFFFFFFFLMLNIYYYFLRFKYLINHTLKKNYKLQMLI